MSINRKQIANLEQGMVQDMYLGEKNKYFEKQVQSDVSLLNVLDMYKFNISDDEKEDFEDIQRDIGQQIEFEGGVVSDGVINSLYNGEGETDFELAIKRLGVQKGETGEEVVEVPTKQQFYDKVRSIYKAKVKEINIFDKQLESFVKELADKITGEEDGTLEQLEAQYEVYKQCVVILSRAKKSTRLREVEILEEGIKKDSKEYFEYLKNYIDMDNHIDTNKYFKNLDLSKLSSNLRKTIEEEMKKDILLESNKIKMEELIKQNQEGIDKELGKDEFRERYKSLIPYIRDAYDTTEGLEVYSTGYNPEKQYHIGVEEQDSLTSLIDFPQNNQEMKTLVTMEVERLVVLHEENTQEGDYISIVKASNGIGSEGEINQTKAKFKKDNFQIQGDIKTKVLEEVEGTDKSIEDVLDDYKAKYSSLLVEDLERSGGNSSQLDNLGVINSLKDSVDSFKKNFHRKLEKDTIQFLLFKAIHKSNIIGNNREFEERVTGRNKIDRKIIKTEFKKTIKEEPGYNESQFSVFFDLMVAKINIKSKNNLMESVIESVEQDKGNYIDGSEFIYHSWLGEFDGPGNIYSVRKQEGNDTNKTFSYPISDTEFITKDKKQDFFKEELNIIKGVQDRDSEMFGQVVSEDMNFQELLIFKTQDTPLTRELELKNMILNIDRIVNVEFFQEENQGFLHLQKIITCVEDIIKSKEYKKVEKDGNKTKIDNAIHNYLEGENVSFVLNTHIPKEKEYIELFKETIKKTEEAVVRGDKDLTKVVKQQFSNNSLLRVEVCENCGGTGRVINKVKQKISTPAGPKLITKKTNEICPNCGGGGMGVINPKPKEEVVDQSVSHEDIPF